MRKVGEKVKSEREAFKVCFVCMGNICRSPTAHAVFRKLVEEAGLADQIEIDSAGTHAYHVGEPPDRRSQQTAAQRGIRMHDLRARQVDLGDFYHYDLMLAMDEANLAILEELRPADGKAEVKLFLAHYAPAFGREVPDPYYGGAEGFERVFDMVEAASQALLTDIQQRLQARSA